MGFEPTSAEANRFTVCRGPPTSPLSQIKTIYQTIKEQKLVAGRGIEPLTGAYETPVLPLHYPAV